MEKDITFSGSFLSINDCKVDKDEFNTLLPEGSYTSNEPYKVNVFKVNYEEHYLKLTSGDGNAKPRNPIVVDIDTQKEEPNPRQPNQVEPKETFGLLDFNTGLLWLSNSKKKSIVIDFLKIKFKTKSVIIKDVYDEEMFLGNLRQLDGIRVSAVPDIFSQSGILKENLVDEIYGYEASIATINFHYQQKLVNENLMEKIKKIFGSRNYLRNIMITGRDEKGLGMLFNSDGFSRKIQFKARIDENEMYCVEDVYKKLITRIADENI